MGKISEGTEVTLDLKYDLKDQMIRDAVMNTQKQVEEIHKDVKIIDERLFDIQKGRKR